MTRRVRQGRAAQSLLPFRADWARRLRRAAPGLRALGLDPSAERDELRWLLTRGERWSASKGVVLSHSRARLLGSNEKLKKNAKVDVYTEGLSLSPALESGISTCPLASMCMRVCVGSAVGRYRIPGMARHRIKKTLYWWLFPDHFIHDLVAEFYFVRGTAYQEYMEPAVRLNVASDIRWELVPQLMDTGMPLYDYTALPWKSRRHRPDSYHLLYSLKEHEGSLDMALEWLRHGHNVAVVVGSPMPPGAADAIEAATARLRTARQRGASPRQIKRLQRMRSRLVNREYKVGPSRAKAAAAALLHRGKLWGINTIPGDVHDARMKDAQPDPLMLADQGAWVVLYAKGPAAYERSDFVLRVDPETGRPLLADFAARRAVEVPWRELERRKAAHRALLDPVIRMQPPEPTERGQVPWGRGRRAVGCFEIPSPWLADPWGDPVVSW